MDKKTVLKIFGEAFLRSMVVLMAIVIIGFVAFFVIKVAKDKKQMKDNEVSQEATYSDDELEEMLNEQNQVTSEDLSTEETTTEEATTEEEIIASTDCKILVLNTTEVSGLAKAWMDKLKAEGFTNVDKGNYSLSHDQQTKIVVKEEGMGEDLLEYFNDAIIEVGTIDSGMDVSGTGVDIFIVIGNNDTTVR